ncbi:hypothetical protein D3C86_1392350 [compost metagenome]
MHRCRACSILHRIVHDRVIDNRCLAMLCPDSSSTGGGIVISNNIVAHGIFILTCHITHQNLSQQVQTAAAIIDATENAIAQYLLIIGDEILLHQCLF